MNFDVRGSKEKRKRVSGDRWNIARAFLPRRFAWEITRASVPAPNELITAELVGSALQLIRPRNLDSSRRAWRVGRLATLRVTERRRLLLKDAGFWAIAIISAAVSHLGARYRRGSREPRQFAWDKRAMRSEIGSRIGRRCNRLL